MDVEASSGDCATLPLCVTDNNEATPDPRQLTLPIPGVSIPPSAGVSIPRPDRVFVNRNLRLSSIKWVGFDMDYTLAIYRQEQMDALSIQLTVERLIRRGYPEYLNEIAFDPRFPIRGILIDRRLGNVLKMDRHKVVNNGYHGLRRLTPEEVTELYHDKKIRPQTPRYHWIDTLFALCEVTSYAAIVHALESRGETVDYDKLFDDVRKAIDEAHAEGAVYHHVTSDLPRYIDRDPHLARTLHKLRSSGKKLFLLTNSPWSYTNTMMTYLLGTASKEYSSWQQYFDVAICAAQKPRWFGEGRPLMERDGDTLKPVEGPLLRGKVYEGGSLAEFESHIGDLGSSVLYVGDHIYGDILRSKKDSVWRTAMIIQELDAEIAALESTSEQRARRRQLSEMRRVLEDQLRYYQGRYKEFSRPTSEESSQGAGDEERESERKRMKRSVDRVRTELRALETEYNQLSEVVDSAFHPYWGSLLKELNGMSLFGQQVDLYADIYMRRVSCLGGYSPEQYFRSPHDLMPHEL